MGCDPPVSTGGQGIAGSPFWTRFFPLNGPRWKRVRARAAARPRPRLQRLRMRHLIQEQIELIHRQECQRLNVLMRPVDCLHEPGALLLVRLVDSLKRRSHSLQCWQCRFKHPNHKCTHRLPACFADCLQNRMLAFIQGNRDARSLRCHSRFRSRMVMHPMLVHHLHHSQRRRFGRRATGDISRPAAAPAG